ncbi:MAG: hypothetical protein JWS12_14 [Candidatus Saccharibacteria bacterium]|nr:hypothetical protein [Candidatus Saccharibacteria bacterium]
MIKYVALLRGIGPHNPNMKGEKLRGVFEGLGFAKVQSVITSGNILFESNDTNVPALEARIEKALPTKLGFTSTTVIRSQAELAKLVTKDPYRGQDHTQKTYLLVTFFKYAPDIKLMLPYQPPNKPYTLQGRIDQAIYGTVDLTSGKTPDYMVWLEKQFGQSITSRTWLTIHRILKKMAES